MKYADFELLDRLAAEYVVGSLRGRARRRFERVCASQPAALHAVHRWEDRLVALNRGIAAVRPSARVWPEIRRRIAAAAGASPRRPMSTRRWQLAAAGIAAAAVLLAVVIRQHQPALQLVAVLGEDSAHPLWRVQRAKELTALTITTVGVVKRTAQQSYELWALPRGGQPVSLGVLPAQGASERRLTAAQRDALLASDKIAVSVEPAGGSATGRPTGPVIIVSGIAASG